MIVILLLFQLLPSTPVTTGDSSLVLEYCDMSYSFLLKNQDSAVFYGEKAIELAEKINYPKGLAQAYNDLGLVYYYNSQYQEAKGLWNSSLKIRKSLGDTTGIAGLHLKIGALNYQVGHLDESLIDFFDALTIYENLKHQEGIAKCLNNIASIYESQGRLDDAAVYFKKAIEIKTEINDYYEVAGSMLNLGGIYYLQGQLERALITYKKTITILDENNFQNSIYGGAVHNNLSQVYIDLDNLDSARLTANIALGIRESLGDIQGMIASNNRLGLIELKGGNYKLSEAILLENLVSAKGKGLLKDIRECYQYLDALKRETKNFEEAIQYSDLFHNIKDSIVNEQSLNNVSELKTKYETEKKEQQIVLQQAEIEKQQTEIEKNKILVTGMGVGFILLIIIGFLARNSMLLKREKLIEKEKTKTKQAQVEAALNSQESERKRFARDLHDSFGQMISVLNLNLKSLEKDGSNKEEIFENSSKVLDEMYKELKGICFNLMPETLIKSGVVDAIKEFAYRVNQTDKIHLDVDTFGIDKRLDDLKEISIYRISQEWVNNILKYSNADMVTISLTKDDKELTLLIEDNGMGFDKNKLINGEGNGWKNMNSRANLINGELELDTTQGMKGSTLIVNAPVFESVEVIA